MYEQIQQLLSQIQIKKQRSKTLAQDISGLKQSIGEQEECIEGNKERIQGLQEQGRDQREINQQIIENLEILKSKNLEVNQFEKEIDLQGLTNGFFSKKESLNQMRGIYQRVLQKIDNNI